MKRRLNGYIDYQTALWLFVFGSVIGFILEGLLAVFKRGAWENHSATVWGPFCIVYGIGAVAVYLVSVIMRDNSPLEQFLLFAVAGSAVEYLCSFLQEFFFGSRSWDYSESFLNINGRICLRMSMIWGVLGLGFARLIFPSAVRLLGRTKGHIWKIGCIAMTVFMAINLIVSAAAVFRWHDRLEGIPPRNRIESYIDSRYGEERMERVYGNMIFDGND